MVDAVKPILVGEQNPYGTDPRYALYPEPEHSAGGRLCRLVFELTPREYIRRFDRVNLLAGSERWGAKVAAARADSLVRENPERTFVLLGQKVQAAFGYAYRPYTVEPGPAGRTFVLLPHPSGLSRAWNEAGAYELARNALRRGKVI